MATREDHEAAGDATGPDINERLASEPKPSIRNPVKLVILPGGSVFLVTAERAKEIRAELDRQIPSEEADALHRLSAAQLGQLGEAIGKGFADKVAGAIRAGFETLDRRGMDG